MRLASLAALATLLIAAPALADNMPFEDGMPSEAELHQAILDSKASNTVPTNTMHLNKIYRADVNKIYRSDGTSGVKTSSSETVQPAPESGSGKNSLPIRFANGSADLTPKGCAQVDVLGRVLTMPDLAGQHFRIEGHTDTTGSDEANLLLSQRRAKAVVNYLVTHFGINPNQLQAVGMGKQGLAVPTPDQTPEPHNRRVVAIPVNS